MIEHAVEEAVELGNTHLYISIENNPNSRKAFRYILGEQNIAAGKTNHEEMCYRIAGKFGDYEKLERHLVEKMGEGWFKLPEEPVPNELEPDPSVAGRLKQAYGLAATALHNITNL